MDSSIVLDNLKVEYLKIEYLKFFRIRISKFIVKYANF